MIGRSKARSLIPLVSVKNCSSSYMIKAVRLGSCCACSGEKRRRSESRDWRRLWIFMMIEDWGTPSQSIRTCLKGRSMYRSDQVSGRCSYYYMGATWRKTQSIDPDRPSIRLVHTLLMVCVRSTILGSARLPNLSAIDIGHIGFKNATPSRYQLFSAPMTKAATRVPYMRY